MKSKVKNEVIEELVASISKITGISSPELIRVLLERERLGSTGIGGGIGIPHGKLKNLESLIMGFGLSRKGVDFESIDGRPAHLFFILLTPENSTGLHLKLLARISRLLKNESFKKKLMKATDSDQVYSIIEEVDEDF
jgi:PTS system nitrogen regulatory IIA component